MKPVLFPRRLVDEASVAQIQSGVVAPVLSALFDAEQVSRRDVWFTARSGGADEDAGAFPGRILWFRVEVAGEDFSQILWGNRSGDADLTIGELASRLADVLEDWIPETSFSWGQQRLADRSAWYGE